MIFVTEDTDHLRQFDTVFENARSLYKFQLKLLQMRALNFPKYSKTTDYIIKPVLSMGSTEVDEDASGIRDLKDPLRNTMTTTKCENVLF